MKLLITGSPGTGKTSVARALGEKLGYMVVNEKDFAERHGIGTTDSKGVREIPLDHLELTLNDFLRREDSVIVEGHLLCEIKLLIDFAIVLTLDPDLLEKRLKERGYDMDKVLDNVFCERTEYCKEKLESNYGSDQIVLIDANKNVDEVVEEIIQKTST